MHTQAITATSWLGRAGALWGVGGFVVLMVSALWRLTPLALEPILQDQLSLGQAALYAGFVVFNAYVEGYRGFQRAFSPRLAARAHHLAQHPRLARALLAPLFCMSMLWATRRRLIASWSLFFAIVMVVLLIRQVPQPWRGIVDGGVVVGLAWGLLSTLWSVWRVVLGDAPKVDPALPVGESLGPSST